MKKYDTYKDTDVEWIGKIPEHWKLKKGKYLIVLDSGYPFDSKNFCHEDCYMPLIRIRDIMSDSTEVFYKGIFPKESIVNKGDILIGMDGDFNIAQWKGENALLNQRVCKINKASKANNKYLYYILQQQLKNINNITYATTVKHLSVYDIYSSELLAPPLSEQQAIVSYLDHKVSMIDKAVAIINAEIDDLKAYRQSVISEAVTKGLNPEASMKDSGVEWIGKIPEHWEVKKGKYLIVLDSGYPFDSKNFCHEDCYMPLIRIRDIMSDSTEVFYKGIFPKESIVNKGDILIGMDGDFNIAQWKGENALLNQRVCKINKASKANNKYLYYILQQQLKNINNITYATTVKHLSVYDIYSSELLAPPLSEQQAISSYLDQKTQKIDSSISHLETQRNDLNALKQSIIFDAVTGKIDVRDWKPNKA